MAVSLCSCASVKLPTSETAPEQFARLGYAEKKVAKNFYELGQADTVKRLFWAQRRAQETGGIAAADVPVDPPLKRRFVVLPVPEHQEPDGTLKEASQQVVEVVSP